MTKPTPQQIKEVMQGLGMNVFTKPYDMTLGGIRTKDNASNTFNDWLFMLCHDENGDLQGIVEAGTTDAGLYYRLNPMQVKGTAIIQHSIQHKGAYTYMLKGGHNGQEAFRQTAPMKYWRDADRDKYLEFEGETFTAIYNTNGHDMGTVGAQVNNWSAGCWGSTQKIMDKFYLYANVQIKHGHGNKFSFALLHENNFQ
jgi:hypothetical protein